MKLKRIGWVPYSIHEKIHEVEFIRPEKKESFREITEWGVDPKEIRFLPVFVKLPAKKKKAIPREHGPCKAVIYCGPGHQSRVECEIRGRHKQHQASDEWYWSKQEDMSGPADQSPEEKKCIPAKRGT